MKPRLVFAAAIFSVIGSIPCGAEIENRDSAIAPLAAGVPQVAIDRLQKLLTQNLTPAERTFARIKLMEALITSGRPTEGLSVFDQDASLTNQTEAIFWRAQGLAALGRWAESAPAYEKVAADPGSSRKAEATFGRAEALRSLGRKEEAIKLLSTLEKDPRWGTRAQLLTVQLMIDRGDLGTAEGMLRAIKPQRAIERSERRFLFGRLSLSQGDPQRAIDTLNVLVRRPEGVSHSLLVATLFALAEAHTRNRSPESGDDPLEEFIDHYPNDDALPEIFARLDELYQLERKPSTNELQRWMRDPTQPRQALAQWYFARSELRSGKQEEAIALLNRLRDSELRLSSLGEAILQLAELELSKRDWPAAIAAAEAARKHNSAPTFQSRVDWLVAEAHYRAGRLEEAGPVFERVAEQRPELAGDALFNAALCWLRLDRSDQFANNFRRIANDPNVRSVQGELLLEEGALQAAQGKGEAVSTFQKFIHDFPQSPRISEAWVALAELAFHQPKPNLESARKNLALARQNNPTPAAVERADYLQIWLADADSSDETQAIAAATNFLERHRDSGFSADVRMKLAEAYYRRGDFANAQTQFELLVQEKPDAPLAEKALFFAARAAMSSMGADSFDHALSLLDQAVKMNGELKWAARNEEAAIERRLGKNREALALYDEVLKNDAKPAERREALCGKGDIYYELGATDPQNYREAIALYEQLANDPGVPAHWRNQAEFKKGKALEQVNDRSAALTTYYSVIEEGMRPELQHEFFWFYKAGFNAAHLLEETKDWKSAVAVYRKLAAVGGTRSDEAKARLTQLRLEHFLWDE
jgi:tetratricopeptide (TPR) repeat protein